MNWEDEITRNCQRFQFYFVKQQYVNLHNNIITLLKLVHFLFKINVYRWITNEIEAPDMAAITVFAVVVIVVITVVVVVVKPWTGAAHSKYRRIPSVFPSCRFRSAASAARETGGAVPQFRKKYHKLIHHQAHAISTSSCPVRARKFGCRGVHRTGYMALSRQIFVCRSFVRLHLQNRRLE